MPRTTISQSPRSKSFIRACCRVLFVMVVFHGHAVGETPLDTPAQAMAQAIARMMESMGFAGAGDPGPVPPNGWPSAFGGVPGMSGMGNQMLPGAAMGRMGERVFGDTMSSGGATALEGVWEDNQGGLLVVQGRFYRLYSACKGSIEGDIRVTGDRVELGNNAGGFTQTFELALDQDRLALRNASGQLYLYRRLVLGPTP